ncbi:TonB C-terminal domain-containing protein [Tepidicaulis sp. LMO-SS28]|uniref:TonB C-terminal domain-containing protein n=1 Tax=Tepidicaulis sp. LMO-SS28 TaxID=3447455 RepID=UPI003EDEFF5D
MLSVPILPSTLAAMEFSFPEAELSLALERYAERTGLELFYETDLIEGKRSSPVEGIFSPEQGLLELLRGTGLTVRATPSGGMTIVRKEEMRAVPGVRQVEADRRLLANLQHEIMREVCADPDLRPGSYAARVAVWVAPPGSIERVRLLRSTGNPRRDGRLLDAVRRSGADMRVSAAPSGPLLIAIEPRPPMLTGDCHHVPVQQAGHR